MHVQCDHQNGIFSKDQVNSKVPAQKSKGYNKNYQGERKLTCSNRRAHQGTYREHVVEQQTLTDLQLETTESLKNIQEVTKLSLNLFCF